jgi:hypothetical protein
MTRAPWPRDPTIYEINTRVWLADLGAKAGTGVTLGSVPAAEWDALAAYGLDAVWLMGVWERSPAGIAISNRNHALVETFRQALPDFRVEDNVGSAYCVRRYMVDEQLGGNQGLAVARSELARRGLRLILDFVPNHVASDHPSVLSHPEHFIQGTADDARNDPASFLERDGRVYALGRDPHFPAWADVLQLNAFATGLRRAAIGTVLDIARQCDGVRCDMAMLMLNRIFERTWSQRAGPPPATDYWQELIPEVKRSHPDFLFLAEAYWDLEWELQRQGFDFCYDKTLYDRLEAGDAEGVRLHLGADRGYQARLLRFVENHDEARVAATRPPTKARAIAVAAATLPGARLFHEGQFEGRAVRVPVFLGRRPAEAPDQELRVFYGRLLRAIDTPAFDGEWTLCPSSGWPDNGSFRNIVAWSWANDDERCLVAINLSGTAAQARLQVPWDEVRGRSWRLADALSGEIYDRNGDELREQGLYVELAPWGCHLLRIVASAR